MIRVMLVDDQELVRSGFRALIEPEADLTVVAEAADGIEAVELAYRTAPEVVLMDVRMPRLDGIAATERIAGESRLAGTRVLILTTFDLDRYVYGALRAGASGFLLKDTAPRQLLEAIRIVASGNALIAPSITIRLIEEFAARPDPATHGERLGTVTKRELDILREVAMGQNNAEIADRLFISPLTVKTHVSRLRAKLDARDRAQLVVIAYETGLVKPGEGAPER